MGTIAMVSVEDYLSTSYPDGDREYVDGQIVERNVGERLHARTQALVAGYLLVHYPQFWAAVSTRVMLTARCCRVPDACLIVGPWPGPERGPLLEPPFPAVEVLSPDDRAGEFQEKIDDYLRAGVKFVWVINPYMKRAEVYTSEGSREAKDGVLRTDDPKIEVPLAELFK